MIAPVKTSTKRGGQRGSVILEGALCLMAFLLMIFGIMEFGWMTYAFNQVSYAARLGARYASVRGSSSGHAIPTTNPAALQTYVESNIVGLAPANLTVTPSWPKGNSPGNTVSVQVQYTYPVIILTPMLGRSFTLSSTATSVISQ